MENNRDESAASCISSMFFGGAVEFAERLEPMTANINMKLVGSMTEAKPLPAVIMTE
jgi:hypothetical protein